jgi:hypothetical protein
LAGVHALLLWRLALTVGYVSERHALPIVLVGCVWAGAAIPELGRRLGQSQKRTGAVVTFVAAVALLTFGLPASLRPLHLNRAGHHAAGCWLAQKISPADEVIDPFAWAHFYSGSVFREGKPATPAKDRYVIVEQSANPHARLPLINQARELAAKGELVYHWPESRSPDRAEVVVYRISAR